MMEPDPMPLDFIGTRPPGETTYLGDGLWARFDGHQIWLFSNTGERVALEPAVLEAFIKYARNYWRIP